MKTNTISSRSVRITPELAKKMLESNKNNRRLTSSIVTRYARLMKAGKWRKNGETIILDLNGDIKDGQHRLAAVVESSTPIETIVVSGVEPDVFDTIDIGKGRTSADALFAAGMTEKSNLVASIANLAIKHEAGALHVHQYVEPHRVLEWVQSHPEVQRAADRAREMSLLGFQPVLGLMHLVISQIDSAKADEFFQKLQTGENLSKGDPALTLRESLIRHKKDRSYQKSDVFKMGMKAFESFAGGQKLSVLKKPARPPRTRMVRIPEAGEAYAA